MKIRVRNMDYKTKNLSFNEDIKLLVKNIFQTQNEGEMGYQMSSESNFVDNEWSNISDKNYHSVNIEEDYITNKKPNFIYNKSLGNLERRFLQHIELSEYRTILLTGSLGSGKTALLKFITEYLSNNINHDDCPDNKNNNCLNKESIIVTINFNLGYPDLRYDKIITSFKTELHNYLYLNIKNILIKNNLMQSFTDMLFSENICKINVYFERFKELIEKDLNGWNKMEVKNKTIKLLKWIESENNDLSSKIDLYSLIIKFIGDQHPERQNGCFLFVFDNIDALPNEVQHRLLYYIFQFVEGSNIRAVISLRLTSFGKILGNKAYSFTIFQNAGHKPVELAIKRIKHYIFNKNSGRYNEWRNLCKKEYLDLMDERLNKAIEYLEDSKDKRLFITSSALSGNSSRRCLFLFERIVRNNILSYTNNKINQDEYIRCLLIGENENCSVSNNDQLTTNLFSDYNDCNSFMNIRILQILRSFEEKKNIKTISSLLFNIYNFGEWKEEEFHQSFSNLMTISKKLIFVSAVGSYESFSDILKSTNDIVNITKTGKLYIDVLVNDLSYLQNCFMSINWTLKNIIKNRPKIETFKLFFEDNLSKKINMNPKEFQPFLKNHFDSFINIMKSNESDINDMLPLDVDYNSTIQRFSFIRNCLNIILYEDIGQMIYYCIKTTPESWISEVKYDNLFSADLISKAANNIYNILRNIIVNSIETEIKKVDAINELMNWKSLLIVANLWQKIILINSNSKIDDLLLKYDKLT